MAITAYFLANPNSVAVPDGVTADTLATLGPEAVEINLDRFEPEASIPNASAATGYTNLATAVKTWATTTLAPAIGLDATATIEMNIEPTSITKEYQEATIYETPVPGYRVKGKITFDVTA